ncbi:hypothetical protein CASFOL_001623 [Castilleja foliolosa]|uniref:Uncharacterized protein n=1 Tax=Castilleja foliolosa TaxID=1961234 RepID=A0ABD3EJP0_9LAMI
MGCAEVKMASCGWNSSNKDARFLEMVLNFEVCEDRFYKQQKKLLNFEVAGAPGNTWQCLFAALQLQHMSNAALKQITLSLGLTVGLMMSFGAISSKNEDSENVERLIDSKDNIFANFRLVVVVVSAATGGIIFSCLGQPVIVGYLLVGSIIGPGGLKFVSEMIQ